MNNIDKLRELEAKLAAAKARAEVGETCGLCGERPTEPNHLFICCENCTDIGVSNVPKEVFELQRRLAAAKAEAQRIRIALQAVEWVATKSRGGGAYWHQCPWCGAYVDAIYHAPDCQRQAALAPAEAEEEEVKQ